VRVPAAAGPQGITRPAHDGPDQKHRSLGSHKPLRAEAAGHASVDPWAQTTPRLQGGPLRWLLPLCAGLLIAAMAGLLLYRTPGSQSLETAAALAVSAQRVEQTLAALQRGQAEAPAQLGPTLDEVELHLAALQSQLQHEAIEAPELAAFAGTWATLRTRLRETSERDAALHAAQAQTRQVSALLPAVRRQLDQRRDDLELALKGLLAAVALALLLPMHALWRQRRQLRSSLHQFSDELGSGTWRDAVHHLREDPLGAPSAFDALASGVESVLGESDRRWQALADLSADWYWETDRQCRLSWLSGSAPQAMAPGGDAAALLGRTRGLPSATGPLKQLVDSKKVPPLELLAHEYFFQRVANNLFVFNNQDAHQCSSPALRLRSGWPPPSRPLTPITLPSPASTLSLTSAPPLRSSLIS